MIMEELMESNPKILVIDDEEGLRDMLSFSLGKEGYKVSTARNGEEGIKKATEEDIDIVITDIKMPGMDGIAVLGKIKEINPRIEVIVATGYGTIESAIESLRKGAFDYINKPFNIDELLAILSKANETKQLRSELVSMKNLDKLKDELLSMIAHELRTPLTAVGGAVKLLMGNSLIEDGMRNELFTIMNRNVQRIRILIDSILDFSKMEAGFWVLKKTDVSAPGMAVNSIKQIMPLAENEKIEIVRQKDLSGREHPAEGIIVNCDQEQIERVLTNFLSNSIKYTPVGGKIAVWAERADEGVKFVVEDNGKGISKESLEKVFDKFYRVDNSLTKKEYGLGLGLSICKKVIELHGGKTWAESEGAGLGSKFIFTLPAKEQTI
jgi:signal transduction histidine kinase